MKHPYGIGLDIGIASVGWAVVALNENAEPYGLIRCGSRIFDKAEQPKTGDSLAAPRREARSARRRLRRRSLRKADLYELMEKNGLPGKAEIEQAVQAGHLPDVYALRVQALDGPVTALDFARILLHLMQRRGFRSNRKADDAQKDGKLLQAIDANTRRMEANRYRTVGEMMYRDPVFAEHKRNKAENYLSTVKRDQIIDEARLVFAAQRQYGATWASPEMEAEYLCILTRQRSFAEGPGKGSPYSGTNRVGTCTLEGKSEQRAAKAAFSFEYFTLLQKINHIRIAENGTSRTLTPAERQVLLSVCCQTDKLDFARVRKALALPEEARFNMVRYRGEQTAEACEKKEKITALPCYHKMRKALNTLRKDHIRNISREQLDAAGAALTNPENEDKLREALKQAEFEPLEIEALLTLPSFAGYGHISVKACRKLIPYLEQGIACTTQGMIKRVSDFCKRAETTAVRNEHFPEPWPHFRDELRQRLSACPQEDLMKINPVYYATVDILSIQPVFVSRMPRHKVTGAAHKETIKSRLDDTHVVQRRNITELKLDKDGEIAGYFNRSSDTLLYNALKARLLAFGGDGKKAFAEPFYKPRADGTPGARVQKVKICDKVTSTVPVHGGKGVADNDTMVRMDVYFVPGDGYYWVPIYVADTVKPELPSKAVVAYKSSAEWKEMKDEDFLFSLCQHDLVRIESKRLMKFKVQNRDSTLEKEMPVNKILAYFEGGNISTGAITVTTHDDAYIADGLGFKTLQKVQKYQVDVLGNYTPVKKEKRQTFPAQRR